MQSTQLAVSDSAPMSVFGQAAFPVPDQAIEPPSSAAFSAAAKQTMAVAAPPAAIDLNQSEVTTAVPGSACSPSPPGLPVTSLAQPAAVAPSEAAQQGGSSDQQHVAVTQAGQTIAPHRHELEDSTVLPLQLPLALTASSHPESRAPFAVAQQITAAAGATVTDQQYDGLTTTGLSPATQGQLGATAPLFLLGLGLEDSGPLPPPPQLPVTGVKFARPASEAPSAAGQQVTCTNQQRCSATQVEQGAAAQALGLEVSVPLLLMGTPAVASNPNAGPSHTAHLQIAAGAPPALQGPSLIGEVSGSSANRIAGPAPLQAPLAAISASMQFPHGQQSVIPLGGVPMLPASARSLPKRLQKAPTALLQQSHEKYVHLLTLYAKLCFWVKCIAVIDGACCSMETLV